MRRLVVSAVAAAILFGGLSVARAQDWLLNAEASRFHMQTVKANAVFETHRFTGLDGKVDKDGNASVKIDLISVASGVDVRDVRMRFLLFETYKFPFAEVTSKLDMGKLAELSTSSRVVYPLKFSLNLHNVTREIETPVIVHRISDKSVSVATAQPIIVNAEPYGLAAGVAKLSETVGGTLIAPAASISFDLVFETGDRVPALEAARVAALRNRDIQETSLISAEACETRFSVISTTQAIYFETGSANLHDDSAPLLNSVAEIANRCPQARIEVTGHTDAVGSRQANRHLSEQRARAVVGYLAQRGVPAARIEAAGFGDTRPVAPNDTEENRAKNRRIEFRVKGG